MNDNQVYKHVEKLIEEEEHLYSKGSLTKDEKKNLEQMKIELDQCWDLLRQRQALVDSGRDPNEAKVRPPDVVENYEQ